MWPFSSKKRSRLAVLLHDGGTWHAHVLAFGTPHWRQIEKTSHVGHNPRHLPEALLDFAAAHGARRVRVVLPQTIHAIQAELPPDAEPEELHTAVAHEVAGETGFDVESVRVAAARAERFRMGGDPNALLAAEFEQSALEQYEEACQAAGLDFDGVGAIELAALGAHAEQRPDMRLLLLRQDSGFYAVPATESTPMFTSAVPLGVREDDSGREPERLERTVRQFKTHRALPLHVWCTPAVDQTREEQLRTIFGETAEVEFHDFDGLTAELARQVAETTEVGVPSGGGAVVGTRAPERDPYRAGTWMLFFVLIITGSCIGYHWHSLRGELQRAEQRVQAWEELQQERKRLEQETGSLRTQQNKCIAIKNLLRKKSPLPDGLLPILDVLERDIPVHTRITSVEQKSSREFIIKGLTHYQEGMSKLDQALRAVLPGHGKLVDAGTFNQVEHSSEQEFSYRVYSSGRAGS